MLALRLPGKKNWSLILHLIQQIKCRIFYFFLVYVHCRVDEKEHIAIREWSKLWPDILYKVLCSIQHVPHWYNSHNAPSMMLLKSLLKISAMRYILDLNQLIDCWHISSGSFPRVRSEYSWSACSYVVILCSKCGASFIRFCRLNCDITPHMFCGKFEWLNLTLRNSQ